MIEVLLQTSPELPARRVVLPGVPRVGDLIRSGSRATSFIERPVVAVVWDESASTVLVRL